MNSQKQPESSRERSAPGELAAVRVVASGGVRDLERLGYLRRP
ncbi:hypothetical protein [Sorangium cellulosum]|nr:hypothetical protein [Sorangium cellulosum]